MGPFVTLPGGSAACSVYDTLFSSFQLEHLFNISALAGILLKSESVYFFPVQFLGRY